jgi:cell division protein FtsB
VRRAVWLVAIGLSLVGAFFIGVSPARTYLAQQRDLDQAEQRLAILKAQNAKLAAKVDRLHTDEEIERLARENYNLVKPGEEAYALLPSPDDEALAEADRAASDTQVEASVPERDQGFWSGLWDDITFWS